MISGKTCISLATIAKKQPLSTLWMQTRPITLQKVYAMKTDRRMLGAFVRAQAESMYKAGRWATARHYESAAARLLEYLGKDDVPMKCMRASTIEGFNAYLRAAGLKPNTLSFYNRNLRALFNRARPGWGTALFKTVFTGNDRTLKRAVPVKVVRKLHERNGLKRCEQLARDIFLFSLYACGISFVDLAYLRPENIRNGYLTYTRRKTGRQVMVKLTSAMRKILGRYAPESKGFLFPFLNINLSPVQNYGRYCSALTLYNRHLKALGTSLTSYVARHTWASVAYRDAGSPVPIISAALGHGSERTTRIYLAVLDHRKVDALQENVQKILCKTPKKEKSLSLGKRQTTGRKGIYNQ